jgi:hypothetical protein
VEHKHRRKPAKRRRKSRFTEAQSHQATEVRQPETVRAELPTKGPKEQSLLYGPYRETRVVLLPVDPYLIHAYWEVASMDLEKAQKQLGAEFQHCDAVLRFYEGTGKGFEGSNAPQTFDVDIAWGAENWYTHLWSPGKAYCADLGFRTRDGRFVSLARSNVAATPRAEPSVETGEPPTQVFGPNREPTPFSDPTRRGAPGPSREGDRADPTCKGDFDPTREGDRATKAGDPQTPLNQVGANRRGPRDVEPPESLGEEAGLVREINHGNRLHQTEVGDAQPVDAGQVLRTKLVELYELRWGLNPLSKSEAVRPRFPQSRPEEIARPDLVELSERILALGLSSRPPDPPHQPRSEQRSVGKRTGRARDRPWSIEQE